MAPPHGVVAAVLVDQMVIMLAVLCASTAVAERAGRWRIKGTGTLLLDMNLRMSAVSFFPVSIRASVLPGLRP